MLSDVVSDDPCPPPLTAKTANCQNENCSVGVVSVLQEAFVPVGRWYIIHRVPSKALSSQVSGCQYQKLSELLYKQHKSFSNYK